MKTKLTSGAVAETAVRTEANTHQSSGSVSEVRTTPRPKPDYIDALLADYIAHPNASVKEDAEPTLPGFTLEIKTRKRGRKPTAPESFSFSAFRVSVPQIRETAAPAVSLRTPEDVAAQLGELSTWAQEAFVLFTLDTKNRVIDRHLVTLGTLNASLVHPREVFRRAIVDSAAAVIVAHNHPSGDPAPSAEDISLTRQLVAAGRTVGISVLDHIIIGNPRAGTVAQKVSLREAGLVAFE